MVETRNSGSYENVREVVRVSLYRYFEHSIESNFRKGEKEQITGYGLVKIPKRDWKENDAESSNIVEPAIITQSQRNSNDNSDGIY